MGPPPPRQNLFRELLCNMKLPWENNMIFRVLSFNDHEVLVHMLWADDLILLAHSGAGLQRKLDGSCTLCGQYQPIVNTLNN